MFELAIATAVSYRAASIRIDLGIAVTERLPLTRDALTAGAITLSHVPAIDARPPR